MAQQKLTKTGWKKLKTHEVTCPSGAVITIQIPNLNKLIASGYLPNELLSAAVKMAQGDTEAASDPKTYEQEDEYKRKVALTAVVEPKLEESDFVGDDAIPQEDVEMIVGLATRQRDMDAAGHHIGGLEKLQSFRDVRGIFGGVEGS